MKGRISKGRLLVTETVGPKKTVGDEFMIYFWVNKDIINL